MMCLFPDGHPEEGLNERSVTFIYRTKERELRLAKTAVCMAQSPLLETRINAGTAALGDLCSLKSPCLSKTHFSEVKSVDGPVCTTTFTRSSVCSTHAWSYAKSE